MWLMGGGRMQRDRQLQSNLFVVVLMVAVAFCPSHEWFHRVSAKPIHLVRMMGSDRVFWRAEASRADGGIWRGMKMLRPSLVLRGGSADAASGGIETDDDTNINDGGTEWGTSDEEIVGEGTGIPGAGVSVQESIVEKLKKSADLMERGSDAGLETWSDLVGQIDDKMWENPFGTMAEQRADRDEYFRENPGQKMPPNETLHFEVRCENMTAALEMLDQGADPNFQDPEGDTALHFAASTGNVTMIDMLVAAGASHNICNEQGNTPLHVAAEFGREDAVRALVKHGANISAANIVEATPLLTAVVHSNELLIDTLVELGADPNVCSFKGASALHHAAGWGHVPTLQALLRNGADPNAKTPFGRTPLDWAAYSNNTGAMRVLCALGVERVDNAMLPALEIKRWAEQKRAATEARRALGEKAPRRERSGSPLIITRTAYSYSGAAEGKDLGLGPDSDDEEDNGEACVASTGGQGSTQQGLSWPTESGTQGHERPESATESATGLQNSLRDLRTDTLQEPTTSDASVGKD